MNTKGIVRVRLLNKDTMAVEYDTTQENTITLMWRSGDIATDNDALIGNEILISSTNAPSYTDFPWMQSAIAGYTPSGATSPLIVYSTQTEPTYTQWSKRFDPPSAGQQRTIYQVGLGNTSYGGASGIRISAYVYLSVPCVQTDSQILDVIYRVQWTASPNSTVGVPTTHTNINRYANLATSGGGTLTPSYFMHNPIRLTYTPEQNKFENIVQYIYPYSSGPGSPKYEGTAVTTWSGAVGIGHSSGGSVNKRVNSRTGTPGAKVGQLVSTEMYVRSDGYVLGWKNIDAPSGSKIQPIHGHAASTFTSASPNPFLDSQPATGTGTLVGSGTWTHPDYPEHYLIKMTSSGPVGTSTYQMWKRNTFGYAGTTYQPRHTPLIQMSTIRSSTPTAIPGGHGLNISTLSKPYTYDVGVLGLRQTVVDHTQIVTADDTGLTLHTLTTGEYQNFDTTTTPALPVTKIQQVSASPSGELWVSCADTGLWQISADRITVQHITVASHGVPADSSYGVSVGRNGRVWAVFDGGLASSVDNGITWITHGTFTFVGITDNNWSTVSYIKADPEHTDDRLALIRKNGAPTLSTTYLVWWDLASGTAVGATGNDQGIMSAQYHTPYISVSPRGSLWGMCGRDTYPRKLTYGTSTLQNIGTTSTSINHMSFEVGPSGQMCYLVLSNIAAAGYTIELYDSTLTNVVTGSCVTTAENINVFSNTWNTPLILYLGKGIFITQTEMNYYGYYQEYFIGVAVDTLNSLVGPFSYLVWEKYGWNGSAWELNHAGSKPTHSAAELLLNGISMSFADGGSGTSFVADEYYTFGVVHGILKDNSISYTTSISSYPYTTKIDTTFDSVIQQHPSVGTVTWDKVSEALTVNPDQSLVNTNISCNYGLTAISNNRVFGDFSITGTIGPVTGTRYISIGLSPGQGIIYRTTPDFTVGSGGSADIISNYSFDINGNSVYCAVSNSQSGLSTISSPTTWELRRVGGTLSYLVGGVVKHTVSAPEYSFVIRVAYGIHYANAPYNAYHTVPPITVVSSGVGYYVAAGISGSNTVSFDPNFVAMDRDPTTFDISINGTPVATKLQGGAAAPAPGEVNICGATGKFLFNAADVGKTVTGSYLYVTK